MQGSSASARAGGKAHTVALVGLGTAHKAKPVAAWGASPFQVSGWIACRSVWKACSQPLLPRMILKAAHPALADLVRDESRRRSDGILHLTAGCWCQHRSHSKGAEGQDGRGRLRGAPLAQRR